MFHDPGTYYFFIISDDIHSKRIGKSQLNTQYELVQYSYYCTVVLTYSLVSQIVQIETKLKKN